MERTSGREILLVEDDAEEAELALEALKRCGAARGVLVARDGAEALSLLFGAPGAPRAPRAEPRLILLDLKLPKVDGFEVLRRLKSEDRTRDIPVVVLTSSKLDADVRRACRLGVNSYIVKPLDFRAFADAVAQIGDYWLHLNRGPE